MSRVGFALALAALTGCASGATGPQLSPSATSVAPASIAVSASYTGDFPLTVTHSRGENGIHCLKLTDNGSDGFTHSGPAVLTIDNFQYQGVFQVIGPIILVSIGSPQGDASAYTATHGNGTLGTGGFSVFLGGQQVDSGVIVFGIKNMC